MKAWSNCIFISHALIEEKPKKWKNLLNYEKFNSCNTDNLDTIRNNLVVHMNDIEINSPVNRFHIFSYILSHK